LGFGIEKGDRDFTTRRFEERKGVGWFDDEGRKEGVSYTHHLFRTEEKGRKEGKTLTYFLESLITKRKT
jgi:hypothetical protein